MAASLAKYILAPLIPLPPRALVDQIPPADFPLVQKLRPDWPHALDLLVIREGFPPAAEAFLAGSGIEDLATADVEVAVLADNIRPRGAFKIVDIEAKLAIGLGQREP